MVSKRHGESDKRALIALISVVFIWGFDFVGVEYCTEHMSLMLISTVKLALAGIILLIFCFIKYKGIHFDKKDWPKIICIGAFGLSGYMNLEAFGIDKVSSPTAALILAIVPVIGLIADRIIYGVKITGIKVIAILGSIVGVALLVLTTGEALKGNASGILIVFIAALIWAFYIIFTKDIFNKYNLLQVMTVIFISGAASSAPLVFVFDKPIYCEPDPVLIGILISTTLISVVLSEVLYAYSISKLSITIVSMAENVMPLITVVFAWLFLGSTLNAYQLIGGLIIIGSVSVITFAERQ